MFRVYCAGLRVEVIVASYNRLSLFTGTKEDIYKQICFFKKVRGTSLPSFSRRYTYYSK